MAVASVIHLAIRGGGILRNKWLLMHLALAVIWSIDATLIYCATRELGASCLWAFLCVATSMIGTQIQLLDDLCVAGGICLFPICLFMYLISVYQSRQVRNNFVWINISLLLVLFALEDYYIYLPALVAVYILVYARKNAFTIYEAVRDNAIMVLGWSIVFLGVLYYILTQISFSVAGIAKGGLQLGAGFSSSKLSLADVIRVFFGGMHKPMIVLCIIVPLLIVLKNFYMHNVNAEKVWFGLIILYCILSEVFLHSKKPIGGRYWLPMLLPIAYVICVVFLKEFKKIYLRIIVGILLTGNLLLCTKDAYFTSLSYRNIFLGYNQVTNYILKEVSAETMIWLEFRDADDNLEIGLQMWLDNAGYSHVFLSGEENRIIDMYKEDAFGDEYNFYDCEKGVCQSQKELYGYFGYYPESASMIYSNEAEIIICTSEALDNIYELLDREYLEKYYCVSYIDEYIIYEKTNENK